jgi:hypothetical protein
MNPTAGQSIPPAPSSEGLRKQAVGGTRGAAVAASPERTLRRLFLTLFLRGRSARGLRKENTPNSVGSKLALTLVFYALFGLFALFFKGQPVFALSVYLHGMTFVFLGLFIAASAGEVLFNKEEADILLHRPVTPRALLRAKIGVLVQVSLWLAGAFNLGGFIVGVGARDGGWSFPVVHAISTSLEALFCTGCVVLSYQVCLRWFGRERLEGLMTATQVLVAVGAVLAGQLVPRMFMGVGGQTGVLPMLVVPIAFMVQDHAKHGRGDFGVAFAGVFLGLIPVLGLTLVQYSQQWQAADLFRAAPIAGPAPLCHGARRAVLCLLTLPVLLVFGVLAWVMRGQISELALLLPGLIALPVYSLFPNLGGKGVPLSLPTEEAKSAGRGLTMIGVMVVSGLLSGAATWAWSGGWFWWLVVFELVAVAALYVGMRASISAARWPPME